MVDNDTSSKIGVGSFNKLLTSGTELNFQKIANWQLYTSVHVDPQNFLWVNIEIIDPLVPKDISRRGGLRSLPFSNRWVSYRKWRLREGVGRKISCLSLNVSEGGRWCLPAKPAFLLCDGSTTQRTENREQQTDWCSKCYFSKIVALSLLEIFRNSYCNSSY